MWDAEDAGPLSSRAVVSPSTTQMGVGDQERNAMKGLTSSPLTGVENFYAFEKFMEPLSSSSPSPSPTGSAVIHLPNIYCEHNYARPPSFQDARNSTSFHELSRGATDSCISIQSGDSIRSLLPIFMTDEQECQQLAGREKNACFQTSRPSEVPRSSTPTDAQLHEGFDFFLSGAERSKETTSQSTTYPPTTASPCTPSARKRLTRTARKSFSPQTRIYSILCAPVLRASHLGLLPGPDQALSVRILAHSCSKLHLSDQAQNPEVHRNLKILGNLCHLLLVHRNVTKHGKIHVVSGGGNKEKIS